MKPDKEKIWKGIEEDPRMVAFNSSQSEKGTIWWKIVGITFLLIAVSYGVYEFIDTKNVHKIASESFRSVQKEKPVGEDLPEENIHHINDKQESVNAEFENATNKTKGNSNELKYEDSQNPTVATKDINSMNQEKLITENSISKNTSDPITVVQEQLSIEQATSLSKKPNNQNSNSIPRTSEVPLESLANLSFDQENNESKEEIRRDQKNTKNVSSNQFNELLIEDRNIAYFIASEIDAPLIKMNTYSYDFLENFSPKKPKQVKKHQLKLRYFAQGGFVYNTIETQDLTSEKKLQLNAFHQYKYGIHGQVGLSATYRKLNFRLDLNAQQSIFNGQFQTIDTVYVRFPDSGLSKRENTTDFLLHQKFNSFYVGSSISYRFTRNAWSLNPYLGIQYMLYSNNQVAILSKDTRDYDVIYENPTRQNKLNFNYGARISRMLNRKTNLLFDVGSSTTEVYKTDQYTAQIRPFRFGIGIERTF